MQFPELLAELDFVVLERDRLARALEDCNAEATERLVAEFNEAWDRAQMLNRELCELANAS